MIQVIHRAIDIIEYVALDPSQPKQMGHIADNLKLNAGTCSNIIKTLVSRRFLKKGQEEKGYLLGDGIAEIASGSFGYKAMLEKASIEMENVSKTLLENTLIAILNGARRQVIQKKIADQLVQATTPDDKPAYDSSTGRLLVAMLSDSELDLYIKKYGLPDKSVWPDAGTKSNFLEQIKEIRMKGYALIEDTVQIVGIATPIYRSGKVIAAFSIYMPSFRFNESFREKMISTSILVARRISS